MPGGIILLAWYRN